MNGTLHFLCVAIYLGTAPLLLAVRALRPKLMPWWLVVALSAGFGWLLSILSAYFSLRYFYDTHPWSLVTTWDPSRRWGWLSGLIYLSLWLGPESKVFYKTLSGKASFPLTRSTYPIAYPCASICGGRPVAR